MDLKLEMNTKITRIFKKANRCVDVLAKIEGDQTKLEVRLVVPPNEIIEKMYCDMKGVAYGRGT